MECLTFTQGCHARGNEDTVDARPHGRQPDIWLCALADGMGGRTGGGQAARIAVQTTLEAAASYEPRQLLHGRRWQQILRTADQATAADTQAGFTTLVGLCVGFSHVYGASCGDSAALLLEGRKTVVLTDRQHKHPPIGSGVARLESFGIRLRSAWKLLVMSDGVWRSMGWETVLQIAQGYQGQDLVSALYKEALSAAGNRLQDDFTLVLLQS